MLYFVLHRLNRERVTELQQQVEDLQKALQSQAAKPDDVSVTGARSQKCILTVQKVIWFPYMYI